MTQIAQLSPRLVLRDAHDALILLKAALNGNDHRWRLHWVSSITLLRAMWHIIENRDSTSEPVRSRWMVVKPKLQHDRRLIAIVNLRNTSLKEYELQVAPLEFGTRSGNDAEWVSHLYLNPTSDDFRVFAEAYGIDVVDALWANWLLWAEVLPYLEGRHDVLVSSAPDA